MDVQPDGVAQARQWHPHAVPPWPLPHSSTGSGVISLASRRERVAAFADSRPIVGKDGLCEACRCQRRPSLTPGGRSGFLLDLNRVVWSD